MLNRTPVVPPRNEQGVQTLRKGASVTLGLGAQPNPQPKVLASCKPRTRLQASETPQPICRAVSRRLAPSWGPTAALRPRCKRHPTILADRKIDTSVDRKPCSAPQPVSVGRGAKNKHNQVVLPPQGQARPDWNGFDVTTCGTALLLLSSSVCLLTSSTHWSRC